MEIKPHQPPVGIGFGSGAEIGKSQKTSKQSNLVLFHVNVQVRRSGSNNEKILPTNDRKNYISYDFPIDHTFNKI